MYIEWQDKKSFTGKSGDLLLARRSQETTPNGGRTTSALIVTEVLSGNYSNLTNGMTIDVTGTTKAQYSTIKSAFQEAVNSQKIKIKFKGFPNE